MIVQLVSTPTCDFVLLSPSDALKDSIFNSSHVRRISVEPIKLPKDTWVRICQLVDHAEYLLKEGVSDRYTATVQLYNLNRKHTWPAIRLNHLVLSNDQREPTKEELAYHVDYILMNTSRFLDKQKYRKQIQVAWQLSRIAAIIILGVGISFAAISAGLLLLGVCSLSLSYLNEKVYDYLHTIEKQETENKEEALQSIRELHKFAIP